MSDIDQQPAAETAEQFAARVVGKHCDICRNTEKPFTPKCAVFGFLLEDGKEQLTHEACYWTARARQAEKGLAEAQQRFIEVHASLCQVVAANRGTVYVTQRDAERAKRAEFNLKIEPLRDGGRRFKLRSPLILASSTREPEEASETPAAAQEQTGIRGDEHG